MAIRIAPRKSEHIVDINVCIFVRCVKISSDVNDHIITVPITLGVSNRSTFITITMEFNSSNIFIHNINYIVGNLPLMKDGDNDGKLVVGEHDG